MSRSELKLTINEGPDGAEIVGIPKDVWRRFKERAKLQFPQQGDDAWASFLSEVILSVGGGTREVMSYFMTDVPVTHADALEKKLAQASWTWDRFHAYLLESAIRPGNFRIINFNGGENTGQQYGTFIATGLLLDSFWRLEQKSNRQFETIMASVFNAAATGEITIEGTLPNDIT